MANLLTKRVVYYLLTALIAITFILPLAWAVVNSIAPNSATSQSDGYGLGNYGALAVYGEGLTTYLSNSVILTFVAVAACLIAATMAGYAIARFTFAGKGLMFVLVLSILMVPYAALLIPLVVWMSELGLDNTLVGVGFVLALFQLPFGTFVMRNAFESIPSELEEAAKLDGCGTFATFMRVMVPSVKAPMVTVGLFVFLNAWNDFMVPLYLLGPQNAPLPLAMVNMRQQVMGVIDYGLTTAGVVVLAIPAVILFLALQKYYIKGLISGAVKG
ncbi:MULTISPECIES: carbohydrate ABC transporter permease [Ruania]|uniref:Carbohydrate ABC transporter permease n=1 Tax=Ruania alkalisoli TaxID=2779775 RepID=A0A7M1SUL9_9MICO|nr:MULTISPECIES: carbohydrate ABC transporter permease [Ruania]QOR71276.1 carbohydrate ABC transporter permease [Ruania alkalisoli]UFU06856.1 carbohydrate ABC transporter permease [Ruania halotolerans]